MNGRLRFNMKRRIRAMQDPELRDRLARSINYGGNPEHKRNPGDFGLTPPSHPRSDKSLCDTVNIFARHEAESLLRAGVARGLISEREQNGYPQNIWSVTDNGYPLEAQLENPEKGTYHGYPMPENDPFRDEVLKTWRRS